MIPDEVTGFFSLPNPSSHTVALGSTQPLTKTSTRNLLGGEGRPGRKADNLTAICELIAYKDVGSSTSHNPMGLHNLITGPVNRNLLQLFDFDFSQDPGVREAYARLARHPDSRNCLMRTDRPTHGLRNYDRRSVETRTRLKSKM
jgi:hypothetical protein